jgi:phage tail sheath protein FI
LIWEQITIELRQRLSEQLRRLLSEVQTNQGIEFFDVICDNRNNTQADADANRLNCQIRLVPTKAVEFIAIDFIVTNSGVEFQ